jgi:hypothetical protein
MDKNLSLDADNHSDSPEVLSNISAGISLLRAQKSIRVNEISDEMRTITKLAFLTL